MLVQNEDHSLGAKIADLGTALKLASPGDKVTDPTGTTGYAGKFPVNSVLFCFVLFCFVLFCFVLFCFVLFCFVLFCFVCLLSCCPVVHCIVYHWSSAVCSKHSLNISTTLLMRLHSARNICRRWLWLAGRCVLLRHRDVGDTSDVLRR
jgi:hypothetical protein